MPVSGGGDAGVDGDAVGDAGADDVGADVGGLGSMVTTGLLFDARAQAVVDPAVAALGVAEGSAVNPARRGAGLVAAVVSAGRVPALRGEGRRTVGEVGWLAGGGLPAADVPMVAVIAGGATAR